VYLNKELRVPSKTAAPEVSEPGTLNIIVLQADDRQFGLVVEGINDTEHVGLMGKIRILVVDDAVVIRRLLSEVLSADLDLEVVGLAANGRIALAKIPQVNPDLLTLDVEMDELDGLQTLAAIRKDYPRLPVVMFSAQTERAASATLEALALGANDFVAKPSGTGGMTMTMQRIRMELIPKIKQLCGRPARAATFPARIAPTRIQPRPPRPLMQPVGLQRVEVLAIGVSTGGPNALAELLPLLPADFPIPTLIVQHMPPVFTRLLAERLAAQSAVAIGEGRTGETLGPGKVWLAPGDYHMSVVCEAQACRLRLHQGPPENTCRPAVDVLFRSVAEAYGPGVLAVVLTGMGQDGLRGCDYIRDAGGQVLVQDEASSVVWGMPGSVARAGLADQVLSLKELGPEILNRVAKGRLPRSRSN
jgi:two-component system chemotaxis response regulator CheB